MSHKHEARVALLADDGSDQETVSKPSNVRIHSFSPKSQYNMKSSAFIATLIGLGVCVIFLFLFLALPMFAPSSNVYNTGSEHGGHGSNSVPNHDHGSEAVSDDHNDHNMGSMNENGSHDMANKQQSSSTASSTTTEKAHHIQ